MTLGAPAAVLDERDDVRGLHPPVARDDDVGGRDLLVDGLGLRVADGKHGDDGDHHLLDVLALLAKQQVASLQLDEGAVDASDDWRHRVRDHPLAMR